MYLSFTACFTHWTGRSGSSSATATWLRRKTSGARTLLKRIWEKTRQWSWQNGTALSSYIAERVRQRFDHLDLNRVSISLYEVSKTTGEVRDVFKFNYEDRPYVILSLSEKIKAGLEVSELLKKIAGINYPVFIDNGESVPVIDNVRPSGQTFISQVVKNEQLRVEILGAAPAGRSEQAA